MPISGPPPKPKAMRRNRSRPVHDWTEIPDVVFEGGPSLPRRTARKLSGDPPTPPRPLGHAGMALWQRIWHAAGPDFSATELLLNLAEMEDERLALRVQVLRDQDWRDRVALRALDAQRIPSLAELERAVAIANPSGWPPPTRAWFKAVGRLPHAALWTEADWQFAVDTAWLVAAFHIGDHRLAGEIRARERIMGTTADARRSCRIRYIDAEGQPTERDHHAVVAMADYRRSVADDG